MQGRYCDIKSGPLFPSHTLKVPNSYFPEDLKDKEWKVGFTASNFAKITVRSNPPEVFLGKGVLKICNIFTGKHPCRSVISKLLCSLIEITLRHGCSPVNLLRIFKPLFYKNTYRGLLLYCCHIWTDASSSYLEMLDQLQKQSCRIVGCSLVT